MKTKQSPITPDSRLTFHIEHHTEKNVDWLLGFLNQLPRHIARKIDSLTLSSCGLGFTWREEPTPGEALHAEAILAARLEHELPDGFERHSM
jgi:hypothetical protein